MQGWIKLHRKILDDPIFQNDKLFKVWIYCLLKASITRRALFVGSREVEVKEGEFVFGRSKASEELGIPGSTVWRYMKKLEKLGKISIRTFTNYSTVFVKSWAIYQNPEKRTGKRTGETEKSGQAVDVNKSHSSGDTTGVDKKSGQVKQEKVDREVNYKWTANGHIQECKECDNVVKNSENSESIYINPSICSAWQKVTGRPFNITDQNVIQNLNSRKADVLRAIDKMSESQFLLDHFTPYKLNRNLDNILANKYQDFDRVKYKKKQHKSEFNSDDEEMMKFLEEHKRDKNAL